MSWHDETEAAWAKFRSDAALTCKGTWFLISYSYGCVSVQWFIHSVLCLLHVAELWFSMSQPPCVVFPKALHVATVKSGLFQLFKNLKIPPPSLFLSPPLKTNGGLMAFFGFLVRGAAVSVLRRIWMVWPRQSGIPGWEIRGLDLSGCTLCRV